MDNKVLNRCTLCGINVVEDYYSEHYMNCAKVTKFNLRIKESEKIKEHPLKPGEFFNEGLMMLRQILVERLVKKTPNDQVLGRYIRRLVNRKPVLTPLSDCEDINSIVLNQLNVDLMDQIAIQDYASGHCTLNNLSYGVVKILVENKIDVFGLIDMDEATSIHDKK